MRSGLAGKLAGLPEVLEVLEDDVARNLGPVRAVKARLHQYFKAIGCLLGQHDGEGLGTLGGGRLSHALLLQCFGNACKVILPRSIGGLPTAANGISHVQNSKSPAADSQARS